MVAVLTDKTCQRNHVKVSVPGGELFITVSEDGRLFLTGPTAIVAEGTVNVKNSSSKDLFILTPLYVRSPGGRNQMNLKNAPYPDKGG